LTHAQEAPIDFSPFYDVRKVREQQLTVRAVCQDLPLSESILRRWLATYDAEQSGTARPMSPEQQRICKSATYLA